MLHFIEAPLEGTCRRPALTVLPPLPKRSMSQLASRLGGHLCSALGLMSWRWTSGHPGRGSEATAGKGAGRPLLDLPNHSFGEGLLYFA